MKPRPARASHRFHRFTVGIAADRIPAAVVLAVGAVALPALPGRAAENGAKPRAHIQSVADFATTSSSASARGMGVTLSRATPVLRRQLGLERGAGLVAEEVKAGSAAARAGFLQHDVLVRLDDQILVLPEQFDALLESAEPEDPLACTVLRGGREVVIPLGRAGVGSVETAAATGRAARSAPRSSGLRPTPSALAIVSPGPRKPPTSDPMRGLTDETLVRNDPDFQIRLARGDETRLTVTDPSGRVVFDGGIDSAANRGRVPVAVRARVADMEKLLEPMTGDDSRVVPASAVAAPGGAPAARIGQLDVSPVELR